MIRTLITLAAALAVTTSAYAAPDTDFPHRDWGKVATLDMSAADATACVARAMDREGSVLVLPTAGGSDIDYTAGSMFGSLNEPWVRFKIREKATGSALTIFYRHPVNQKWLRRVMRNFQKQCLKVASVSPAN